MRLFIAIELPEIVKQQLASLRMDIPGVRWVPPVQLHLTLAFLGVVTEETQSMLEKHLETICMPVFPVHFTQTGCFPDRRRPRVLWVGVEPEPLLAMLAGNIRTSVLACGIPQEARPFSPHITLARIKVPGAGDVRTFLDHSLEGDILPLDVRNFTLFASRLDATGAVHTAIKSFQLTG